MEKRGWLTWFTWKTNKVPDKELAPSTLGRQHTFEYQRVPCLGLSLLRILEAGTSKYTWWASMTQMGIQPEIKEETGGNQSSDWPRPLLSRKAFYTFLIVHRDQWVIQNYAALAAQTLIKNQAFLSAYLVVYTSLRWFTSSFGQKGQLTFHSLFSDKVLSTRRLICVDLPEVWCHSQKALNKVTFLHSKDTAPYNK